MNNMNTPLVSVLTQTYNHAPFIRQCIEGVMMQKTTFTFEFLIHDDASTDETADIIREYEARYPDVIKPIYQDENQFSKKIVSILNGLQFPRVQGKYVAICEGDDYWTDPLKLQKQVVFLEAYPDYTICGGMYWILNNENSELTERDWMVREMKKFPKGKTVTLQNFLYPYMLQFLTVCFRWDSFNKEKNNQIRSGKDDVYYAILLEQGKGFVFPDYFGVYRMHQGGIFAGVESEVKVRQNEKCYGELVIHFGNKSKSIRNAYFKTAIGVRIIELKKSKHPVMNFMKMVRFTFSGKIIDVISFQIPFFFSVSCGGVIRYFKNKFNKNVSS